MEEVGVVARQRGLITAYTSGGGFAIDAQGIRARIGGSVAWGEVRDDWRAVEAGPEGHHGRKVTKVTPHPLLCAPPSEGSCASAPSSSFSSSPEIEDQRDAGGGAASFPRGRSGDGTRSLESSPSVAMPSALSRRITAMMAIQPRVGFLQPSHSGAPTPRRRPAPLLFVGQRH